MEHNSLEFYIQLQNVDVEEKSWKQFPNSDQMCFMN